jgi:hypothetical protein
MILKMCCLFSDIKLDGRDKVSAKDLQTGVILAMASRGDFFPEEGTTSDEQLPAPPASPQSSLQPLPPPPDIDQREEEEAEQEEQQEESEDEEPGETEEEKHEEEEMLEIPLQFLFGVDAVPVDPKLMYFNKWTRKGKGGKRSRIFNLLRGKYIKVNRLTDFYVCPFILRLILFSCLLLFYPFSPFFQMDEKGRLPSLRH